MRTLFVTILLLMGGLAGCLDDDAAPVDDVDPAPVVTGGNGSAPAFGPHSGLPRTLEETPARNLSAAPEWVLGEWWTIRLTSYFDGKVTELTRVVSGKEGDAYLIGMPQEAFDNEAMVMHVPGFGLVDHATRGFEAHDVMFEPLRFPMVPGDTWDTLFEAPNARVDFLVDDVQGNTAFLSGSGARGFTMEYDADMGAITLMDIAGYGKYEVIDHGFDYEGMVTVPYKHDLIFFNGRLAGAVDLSQPFVPPTPAAPLETVTIPDEYDRVSFSLILGDIVTGGALPADPGYYDIDVTAPDGTNYKATKTAADGQTLTLSSYGHDQPAGDWDIVAVAGGPGVSFIEGIAYIVYDVALPDGCVVLTNRIHDHGGECGGHVHGLE